MENKMKIAYISDLHSEFNGYVPLPLNEHVDVLILAGDIGKGSKGFIDHYEFYRGKFDTLVGVNGNHEYYGGSWDSVNDQTQALNAFKNVHILQNDGVRLGEYYFLGATLWTDFDYGIEAQPYAKLTVQKSLNDYRLIRKMNKDTVTGTFRSDRLTGDDTLAENINSKKYIFKMLEQKGRENCIVVTHHAPCTLSVAERYKHDPVTAGFANRWDNLVAENGPKLWFHGHLHNDCDYTIGNTRVLCNPKGYNGELKQREIKILEI